jgi:hypothetical protein
MLFRRRLESGLRGPSPNKQSLTMTKTKIKRTAERMRGTGSARRIERGSENRTGSKTGHPYPLSLASLFWNILTRFAPHLSPFVPYLSL